VGQALDLNVTRREGVTLLLRVERSLIAPLARPQILQQAVEDPLLVESFFARFHGGAECRVPYGIDGGTLQSAPPRECSVDRGVVSPGLGRGGDAANVVGNTYAAPVEITVKVGQTLALDVARPKSVTLLSRFERSLMVIRSRGPLSKVVYRQVGLANRKRPNVSLAFVFKGFGRWWPRD